MAAFLVVCIAGCRSEPTRLASYEWADPAAEVGPFLVYPGATVLVEQTELVRRARGLLEPKGGAERHLLLADTDAPIDTIAAHFAALYATDSGAPVPLQTGVGDHASDEASLAPVLTKLGVRHTPCTGDCGYRWVEIPRDGKRPSISIQRPWRNFIEDRIVDRTLITISE
ncbi:MAG: hypothetical protein ACSLFQ_14295 [Thermoanaerobaculia bacterium]